MAQPWDRQTHTLAQFARRAGISEGRARALYAATPSGLPRPDRTDADGRPLWWASTIDAWCARTGRQVRDDALWLFRAPAAAAPAPELQRGVVHLDGARRTPFYAIVWDTEHGHVIYLQPLAKTGDHKDWVAVHAAELIEPRWWADAVVVMPLEEQLRTTGWRDTPLAYVYRLVVAGGPADDDPDPEDRFAGGDGVFGGLRRWFQRTVPEMAGPAKPKASWAGQLDLEDIAKAIGRPVPVWLDDTTTVASAEQTLSYDRTFTVPDTVTAWPAAQQRLERAVECGLASEYPAAFAALAVDAAEGLAKLRAAHEATPDTGPGWYLVCRPARPAPPIELEQRITGARPVGDLDLVAKELTELREVEGGLDVDDPRGEVYAEAVTLLEWQLRYAAKQDGRIRDLGSDYVPVADDGLLRYSAPWAGPVVDAWRKTLTEVDVADALRLRRVDRLLEGYRSATVRQAHRDPDGRYVLVVELGNGHVWSMAEWPVSLDRVADWTDKTVIAGDDEQGTTTTLLALTPTDDGRMRVDPVPLPPRSDRDAFAYGYGGGTPATTYQALLRCALGDGANIHRIMRTTAENRRLNPDASSQLWKTISTTKGPLRLSWPQLQLWARADRKASNADGSDR